MEPPMDNELKELAGLALRNAFWHDFSALVNKYLAAANGLDAALQEAQIGEMTSVYGRDTDAEGDISLNIWTQDFEFVTTGHETIVEALEHEPATKIYLCGKQVFERRGGEWYFNEE